MQIQPGTYKVGGVEFTVEKDGYRYILVVKGDRLRFNDNGYPIEESKAPADSRRSEK